jgi:hypothetical protein
MRPAVKVNVMTFQDRVLLSVKLMEQTIVQAMYDCRLKGVVAAGKPRKIQRIRPGNALVRHP